MFYGLHNIFILHSIIFFINWIGALFWSLTKKIKQTVNLKNKYLLNEALKNVFLRKFKYIKRSVNSVSKRDHVLVGARQPVEGAKHRLSTSWKQHSFFFHCKILHDLINIQLKHHFKNIQHSIMEMIIRDSSIPRTTPHKSVTKCDKKPPKSISITVQIHPQQNETSSVPWFGIQVWMINKVDWRRDGVPSICCQDSGIHW